MTTEEIATIIILGATAALKGTAKKAVSDLYRGVVTLIREKYHDRRDLHKALDAVEQRPAEPASVKQLVAELQTLPNEIEERILEKLKELDALARPQIPSNDPVWASINTSVSKKFDIQVPMGRGIRLGHVDSEVITIRPAEEPGAPKGRRRQAR